MNVLDAISTSVIVLYIIPFCLYIFTGNYIHFKAFLGTIGTTIISETIKYFFVGKASPRPQGAKDCNLMCMMEIKLVSPVCRRRIQQKLPFSQDFITSKLQIQLYEGY